MNAAELPISSDLERRTGWFIRLRWLAAAGVAVAAVSMHLAGAAHLAGSWHWPPVSFSTTQSFS